jgi:hypothetical protein
VHHHGALAPAQPSADGQGRSVPVEVADIFRAHGDAYRRNHALSPAHLGVMRAIETCRTAVLGGHLDVCDTCGDARPAYNSCRNRHCPKCQALKQAMWIAARTERVLPIQHFHVVFTIPAELKPLFRRNPVRLYDMLFAAAAQTLLELGSDPKHLGGLLGVTAVLHTWTRALEFHPHIHCIVTGGGLAPGDERWISAGQDFLFPVKVMARLFRGKLLAAIASAHERGRLHLEGPAAHLAEPGAFAKWKSDLYKADWVVYAKRPFGDAGQVFRYLGRYTHRVGISNHRLISADDNAVRFRTKGDGTCTVAPHEFIRRFLLHVLPRGFVKIRHFGLLAAANVTTRLGAARRLLETPAPLESPSHRPDAALTQIVAGAAEAGEPSPAPAWRELFKQLTGIDLARCRACGVGTIVARPLPAASPPDTS